ncbi:MAG: transposase, partial [Deltaproteobacteria bacterium]|nr:transposase [Deltaproteobacteria bacterium]
TTFQERMAPSPQTGHFANPLADVGRLVGYPSIQPFRDPALGYRTARHQMVLTVRVLFVHRNGFRRRRLVTSLLDPVLFPASDLARLYHMRWDIETFYRDFKHTMQATSWHCHTPTSFHQELLVHMITLCLIRIAMIEASHLANVSVAHLSFARALAETRLFLKLLLSTPGVLMWSTM